MDQALDASALPENGDIDLQEMLRRSLLAGERAVLDGRRGEAEALLMPVVELARALSENAAFVNQRAQLIELGDRAQSFLQGDGTPSPLEGAPPSPAPLAPPAPAAPPAPPAAASRAAEAAELATLLERSADEIDRLEQARRRIAAL